MDNKDIKVEHELFRISIFLKGIYSFFEIIAGILFLFISSATFHNFISYLFRRELIEDPRDFVVNYLVTITGNLSQQIKLFLAIYLIIHGVVKLVLIIGLWKRKLVFYPIAIAVFGLFIIYQIFRYIFHPSVILLILTDLDMLIIILTLLEWRNLRNKVKK